MPDPHIIPDLNAGDQLKIGRTVRRVSDNDTAIKMAKAGLDEWQALVEAKLPEAHTLEVRHTVTPGPEWLVERHVRVVEDATSLALQESDDPKRV